MTSQRFGDASWSNGADEHKHDGICVMSGAVKLEPENDHEKKVATDGKG